MHLHSPSLYISAAGGAATGKKPSTRQHDSRRRSSAGQSTGSCSGGTSGLESGTDKEGAEEGEIVNVHATFMEHAPARGVSVPAETISNPLGS